MKKLAYLCFALLLLGCANVSEEKSFATSDSEESGTVGSSPVSIEEAFPFATVTAQKLQEYFDLLALKNKHPEFAESISQQLTQLTTDTIKLPKGQDSVAIKNLRAIGKVITFNDTLQQQKFEYSIASKTIFKTDTLTANIITKTIQIDGEEIRSTKVIFSEN